MPRIKTKEEQKKQKKEEPKKYIEKTLHQHCMDGIVKILKELSGDDNVNYHVVKGTNQCTPLGSFEMVSVNGSCRVGYFTMAGQHHLGPKGQGFEIKYVFQGKVVTDDWNQYEIKVESSSVDGLDHMEGLYNKDGSKNEVVS